MTSLTASLALAIVSMFVAVGGLGYVIWRLDQIVEDLDVLIADRKRTPRR